MSWKTTLFGIMQGVGGAIILGYVTLLIHPDALPHWFKYTTAVAFLVGCIGDGYYGVDRSEVKRLVDEALNKPK